MTSDGCSLARIVSFTNARWNERAAAGSANVDRMRCIRGRKSALCNCLFTLWSASLLFVAPLDAQVRGRITGVVIDATSGEPIADALVTLVGAYQRTQTDRQGWYTLDVHPGAVQLRARMVGFQPLMTVQHVVRADSTLQINMSLERMLYNIEAIEIEGRRPSRSSYPGARVLSAEQLPPLGNVLTALQGLVPSLRTTGRRDEQGVRIRSARSDVLYVIDGTVVTPPLTFYLDTAEVECVEIRSGFRAAHEFRPINGEMYGGVILIWTLGTSQPQPRQCL